MKELFKDFYYYRSKADKVADELGYKISRETLASPFLVEEGKNSVQDIKDFGEMINTFIDIKRGSPDAMVSLLNLPSREQGKFMKQLHLALQDQNLEKKTDLLFSLVDLVKTEFTCGFMIGGRNSEKRVRRCRQQLLLELIILLNYNQFHQLFQRHNFYDYATQKALTTIEDFTNDSMRAIGSVDRLFITTYVAPSKVMNSIFQAGFFNRISEYAFHYLFPMTLRIREPQAIFGAVVGMAINDTMILRRVSAK